MSAEILAALMWRMNMTYLVSVGCRNTGDRHQPLAISLLLPDFSLPTIAHNMEHAWTIPNAENFRYGLVTPLFAWHYPQILIGNMQPLRANPLWQLLVDFQWSPLNINEINLGFRVSRIWDNPSPIRENTYAFLVRMLRFHFEFLLHYRASVNIDIPSSIFQNA